MLLNESAIAFLTRVSADVTFGTIVLSAVLGSLSYPFPSNVTIILTTILSLQVITNPTYYPGTESVIVPGLKFRFFF